MMRILFLIFTLGTTHAATLGDGRISLITGKAVDHRSLDACVIDGVNYASETSVPRQHPCHYCICYGGKVDCFWKKCNSVPQGCQVMDLENACNPSLYICEIPEKARHAPNYGSARQVITAPPAPTTRHSDAPNPPAPVETPRGTVTNPTPKPTVPVAPTTTLASTTATTPKIAIGSPSDVITPPSRHLQPPDPPAVAAAAGQIKSARLVNDRSPSHFGLRMKSKMRFSRSTRRQTRALPFNIEEPFPIKFDQEFAADLQRRIRQRRSILGSSADNHDHHHDHEHHDHHHDHHEPIDTGCTILGVHYQLGQVVGLATDQCQECRCAAQSLFCSPKCCFKPAPFEIVPHIMAIFEQTRNLPSDEAVVQNPLYYVQSEFQ